MSKRTFRDIKYFPNVTQMLSRKFALKTRVICLTNFKDYFFSVTKPTPNGKLIIYNARQLSLRKKNKVSGC